MKQVKLFILIPYLLICLEAFSQQPIFVQAWGNNLYSLDINNCTSNYIGTTSVYFADIALTPDGRLWGIGPGGLYQIDTSNSNTTLIGSTTVTGNNLVALNDSILLMEYGAKLYGVKNTDATVYLIDSIGYWASGDLTWYDNDLFLNHSSMLVKITLDSTNSTILSSAPVNNISNPIPYFEGMITVAFPSLYNSIIGFPGGYVIKICQIDGTYQMLCPVIFPFGVVGAASIRLATQIPQPTSCVMTGIHENSGENLFAVFPNPTTNKINIQTHIKNNLSFNIYNSLGQIIKSGMLEANTYSIDINNLANGIYNIELSADGKTERKCFIVEK